MTEKFVTLPREVVERTLEALSLALSDVDWRKDSPTQPVIHKAYNATCAAMEQPQDEHEPVGEAGSMPGADGFTMACFRASDVSVGTELYTHPQPKPLTDEAVLGVAKSIEIQFDSERLNEQIDDILAFARAIEAAHNIK